MKLLNDIIEFGNYEFFMDDIGEGVGYGELNGKWYRWEMGDDVEEEVIEIYNNVGFDGIKNEGIEYYKCIDEDGNIIDGKLEIVRDWFKSFNWEV